MSKNKGSHVSQHKTELSPDEFFLLEKLTFLTTPVIAKELVPMLQWDIRKTTFNLSTLVGLDLVHMSSDDRPLYYIPVSFTERVIKVRSRRGSLKPLFEGIEMGLWPYRDIDRLDFGGSVVQEGDKLRVKFESGKLSRLKEFAGKKIKIRIELA